MYAALGQQNEGIHKRDVARETTERTGKAHRQSGQQRLMSQFSFPPPLHSILVPFTSFCFCFSFSFFFIFVGFLRHAITILIAIGYESRHNEKLAKIEKALEEAKRMKQSMTSMLRESETLRNYYRNFFPFLCFYFCA